MCQCSNVPEVAVVSPPQAFLSTLMPYEPTVRWQSWAEECRADLLKRTARDRPLVGQIHMPDVIRALRALGADDAIVCTAAGNTKGWVHRYFELRQPGALPGATNGAMAHSVPAAIADELARPDRVVISFAGDGCFLTTAQELATAVRARGAHFVVVNSGTCGTIRAHQGRHDPNRVISSDLVNPDFAAFARSFGIAAEVVERTADFGPSRRRALQGQTSLIELRMDHQDISTRATLAQIRTAGPTARHA